MKNPDSSNNNPNTNNHPATVLTSKELLGERRELVILHEGELYRLRLTKNNKLILTK
jgi:hemin uptake protein HemP